MNTDLHPARIRPIIGGSQLAGAAIALLLTLVVFPGDTESVITGSLLVGWGFGWALLAVLSARWTSRPQTWAAVPAVAMTASGVALVVLSPQHTTLTWLGWVWPPALLLLVAWTFVQMRRALPGQGRGLLTPVLVVLALAGAGAIAQNVAAVHGADAHPAAGETYAVGDHRLHLDCRGTGGPTVVLFNGLGESSASWAGILDQVGDTTRVCAYDRAGQGWSDDVAAPQDGVTAAEDLHLLLAAAGEEGPFVLAGHSTGGTYAMSYAAQHPDDVAGMVLLDSSSPRQLTDIPSYALQYAAMRRGLAFLPTLGRLGLGDVRAARNGRDEVSVVPEVFEQAQALTTLGGLPLVVLTASETLGTEGWAAAQEQMAELSTNSAHRTVDSSHQGLVGDRDAAVESVRAIGQVVSAVKDGGLVTDAG
jgi:pimeloyl-ACP methyl ester carboxylesterase